MKEQKKKQVTSITDPFIWFVLLVGFSLLFLFFYSFDYQYYYLGLTAKARQAPPSPDNNSFTSNTTSIINPCSGRYIYVHDLESKFNNDVMKNCTALVKWFDLCPYLTNQGLGPQVQNPEGVLQNRSWFATNQFFLEVIFRERMKKYKCLTNDSSLASAIYVPFYAGFDIGRHLWDYNTSVRDYLAVDLVKWLASQKEWQKMWGRDHFFVSGRISWDFRRLTSNDSDWGSKLMKLPESMNMTMLSIETTSWSNEFAIPYPTYFHPSSDGEVLQWQNWMRRHKRRYLFAFAGAPRPTMENSIRGEIIRQCLASGKRCKFLDCTVSGKCENPVEVIKVFRDSVFCLQPPGDSYSRRSIFDSILADCTVSGKCENPVEVIKVFRDSVFCLQPPGDSYSRRSIFDSILAGCIPVFFHPFSAYAQYTWYFPKTYGNYSVFIPEYLLKEGNATMINKTLHQVPKDQASAMREEVIKLIPKVVYGDPRSNLDIFEDAFGVAVKGVLRRIEEVRRKIKEGKDPSSGFAEENSWKHKLASIGVEGEWDSFLKSDYKI
ncbi:hypothetical protein Tsubulata_046494 [Turnera subulata]|uniref:Exostosin GT47 domain-containing protein n=1 Tax=Turnera subulata TaxID=218843 RepID=A0A9Q0G4E6_9ROSI|nr:hypothetical protein Tsubulata_046494 [Turnera subulata]